MNRSILIVICDFLLVSLLAFSTVDINQTPGSGAQKSARLDLAKKPADSDKDLAAVMRLALDEERRNRDALVGELAQARASASRQQTLLNEREQQVRSAQQDAARLEQQRTNLQQQYAEAQSSIQTLNQQLHNSATEASQSRERLAAMAAEARKQAEQAAALQQQMAQLERSNQMVLAERQRLAGQLQVAEVEKRNATEQVVRMQEEVKAEREEKAKLAEGVKALASKSGELAQEVRENRPLAANTIFSDFLTNRVQARFSAVRSGLLGEATRNQATQTVLVTDGTNFLALCHVQDTPLTLWTPGTDWQGLTGTLSHRGTALPIRSLSFGWPDPRVVLLPVSPTEARQLGCKVYRISPDPYKFQNAVLVGADEGYYGECSFQIDPTTPGYVKLDRSLLRGLFGKFNPSRGDLVFSGTGELLGVMANNTYCIMIRNFDATTTFQFNEDVRAQHTGQALSQLHSVVLGMPLKLQ